MIKVLFLCTHNSARSQIAEAYCRKFGGEGFQVESAGLEPGSLNPYVVRALKEDGIDISANRPKDVFALWRAGRAYRYVVTVCSREAAEGCPIFPGVADRFYWPFPDPATFAGNDGEIMDQVRRLRDEIKGRVQEFVDVVTERA